MAIFYAKGEVLQWTNHSKWKMRYYRLSENTVKRVLHHPQRVEEGIASETLACMQKAGTKKHPTEIWVMYVVVKSPKSRIQKSKLRIVSAWRYPGETPKGQRPVVPEDILRELGLKDF